MGYMSTSDTKLYKIWSLRWNEGRKVHWREIKG